MVGMGLAGGGQAGRAERSAGARSGGWEGRVGRGVCWC